MKFVYVTDLHGDEGKYEMAFALAAKMKASVLHVGADILPKGYSMQPRQKDFIKKFLPAFIKRCKDRDIKFIAMFGNDDLWARKPLYRDKCGDLLDDKPIEIEGFVFTGYPYVPDYPFGLKTACKYDHKGWKPERYIHIPVEDTEQGIVPIKDVQEYFKKKGTIEDDFRDRKAAANEIIAIHAPPLGVDLDVCLDGRMVGSKAVGKWIESARPYLVLCGHIHECPWAPCGGSIAQMDGGTWVVQPGQYLSAASVDPSRLETFSEDDLKQNPWTDTSRLRAAVIEAVAGEEPRIDIVDP
jgi:Icc-related predicted phosphoesterase